MVHSDSSPTYKPISRTSRYLRSKASEHFGFPVLLYASLPKYMKILADRAKVYYILLGYPAGSVEYALRNSLN